MFDVLEAPPALMTDSPPPDMVAPEDLVEELVSIFAHRDRDDARAAELLHQIRETEAFRHDGYSSLTAMLKHRMSLHPGEAQRLVVRANGLAETPLIALAYARGAISGAQVDVLLEARSTAPDAFSEAEGHLVALALDTSLIRDLRKQLDYWLDQVAAIDLMAERNLVRELRSLTLRRDGEMMWINGWLDIEAGERLRAELEPGPPAEGDDRSTPARRADILLDILNGASGRPNLTVHVAAETLIQGAPGISETSTGTFLTAEEIRRLACEANLTRVIFGPESQPLDVGRTKRLVTPALRAAVCARDLRCVFPTCDRASNWCDVHHLTHWAGGGETSIDNLILLCRHHHVLVHEGGWSLSGTPGHLRFFRPDGTELGAKRRPDHHPSAPSSPWNQLAGSHAGVSSLPSGRSGVLPIRSRRSGHHQSGILPEQPLIPVIHMLSDRGQRRFAHLPEWAERNRVRSVRLPGADDPPVLEYDRCDPAGGLRSNWRSTRQDSAWSQVSSTSGGGLVVAAMR